MRFMWILPSLNRPHNLKRFRKAYIETGATTPVWLRLNKTDSRLGEYEIYQDWITVIGDHKPLSDIYAEAFEQYSTAEWYGFLADDVVPRTPGWDRTLVDVAGLDGMAAPSGGHSDFDGIPHFVLGGDLVREIGWLALPGLDRLYIDKVWQDIAEAKGVLRHAPEVILEHMHFSNGKALMDSTYQKHRKAEDRRIYLNWRENGYNLLKGGMYGNSEP